MVMSVMNPIGSALAQVVSPLTSEPRQAVRTPLPAHDLPRTLTPIRVDPGSWYHRDRCSSGCLPHLEATTDSSKYGLV